MVTQPGSKTSYFFKKLYKQTKSQRRRLCQLISVMECSLFLISWPLRMGPLGRFKTSVRNYHPTLRNISEEGRSHMTIWQCSPRFSSAWSGSERSGSALHTRIYDNLTYLSAKFKEKNLIFE